MAKGEIIWSEQTYRIYEIDPALPVTFDLVGTRIHPEEASWFQDLLGRASSEGRDLEFEHRLQMPDQSVRYLHVVAHATRDQDGQLEYIGAVQDVTERRRSEDALNKLRSELAHMGEGHHTRRADRLHCPRSQSTALGHHHEREYVVADAGRRSS